MEQPDGGQQEGTAGAGGGTSQAEREAAVRGGAGGGAMSPEPTAKPVMAEWSVIQVGVGRAEAAIVAALIDGEFISRVDDERVMDVHHWHMYSGNRFCLIRGLVDHPRKTRARLGTEPGGRSFVVNEDGTISPKMAPHLVLCREAEAVAVDYTVGAAIVREATRAAGALWA